MSLLDASLACGRGEGKGGEGGNIDATSDGEYITIETSLRRIIGSVRHETMESTVPGGSRIFPLAIFMGNMIPRISVSFPVLRHP